MCFFINFILKLTLRSTHMGFDFQRRVKILLFNFLGMCSYLACSNKLSTARGLGLAVCVVTTLSGTLNWFIHRFVTGKGALNWLSNFGLNPSGINLSFLEFLIYISVIAAFVQVLEIVIDKFAPNLYRSLGMFLPLITVNCAILGGSLFMVSKEYNFNKRQRRSIA